MCNIHKEWNSKFEKFICIIEVFDLWSFILKRYKFSIYGIVCDEGSKLIMNYCEIKGSKLKQTIGKSNKLGIISKWADLQISECFIH